MITPAPALELTAIARRFGSLVALENVSLRVRPGTVHALLGENGAGKTTLMRIAYGMVRPDAGAVHIAGVRRTLHSPADAIDAGLGMVHQHFTLVPAMTVGENLLLGGRGRIARDAEARVTAASSESTGFALDASALVEELPVGAQQRVEIAKALAREARVLILDEPTAVLAPAEVDELLAWLRRFVAAGHAAVLITHKLREALAVADDVTVLHRGRVAWHGPASDTTPALLTQAMLGAGMPVVVDAVASSRAEGEVVLAANDVSFAHGGLTRVASATFDVRAGEILGIAAVEGSGQRELLRLLAGRLQPTSGTMRLAAHVGFIPDDRHRDAVLLERDLVENVALRGAGRRRGRLRWRRFRDVTESLVRELDVRVHADVAVMRELSGGNQQKLVLARELGTIDDWAPLPTAVVAENPTRGLDVRATADVHARLREARARGAAVVLYSSDLDEVLALASRMLVVHAGGVRLLPVDRDAVGRAMMGLA